ncbi:MAG: geranylgeranyl pyrophosphate synthase [Bacillariaceae sp.]|jgi:geranylgeranyl pyrophosphate synthase
MSTLSFASKCPHLRKIPQVLKNNIPFGGSLGSWYSSSSLVDESRRICPISTTVRQPHQQRQCRYKSSSTAASIADFLLPDSVKKSVQESVKTSILDRVTKDDSKVWASGYNINSSNLNGQHGQHNKHDNDDDKNSYNNNNNSNGVVKGGVDEQISSWHHDPLDDLYLDTETTQYWPNLPPGVRVDADPFQLTKVDVDSLSKSIREDLLGTDHPVLNKAASYFFGDADGGKKVRPLMVMLLSRALADTVGSSSNCNGSDKHRRDLNDDETQTLFTQPLTWQRQDLPQAQRRLAEISEIIHTASLFHDDVIDESETRRGVSAVHMVFGNKTAILAGDYLLARASISLARLRHVEVVECMSTIIEHLVRGEVMQMRGTASSEGNTNERMIYYLKKNYYKTASLMANSCKSTALLAECSPELVLASYNYGKSVGMAFQLVDDVLDFEGDVKSMGKPALTDLRAGLSTAPVLFAAEEYPGLEVMMDRKFKEDGDVEKSRELVLHSQGIERTKELARVHAERAMEAILPWEESEHRDALINLAYKVVQRTK